MKPSGKRIPLSQVLHRVDYRPGLDQDKWAAAGEQAIAGVPRGKDEPHHFHMRRLAAKRNEIYGSMKLAEEAAEAARRKT